MLRIEKLKAGPLPALSFEVADGQCLAIEGPSGVGKSRLLRAIADLDPAEGRVFLDGVERREIPAAEWRRRVRYCATEPGWWSETPRAGLWSETPRAGLWSQTPRARIWPGTEVAAAGASVADDKRLLRLLGSLGLTSELLDRPISVLSTGERQRLGLARALLDEPKVVLLDEPTASLDLANSALVDELIKYVLLAGSTVLLVSHDPRQIGRLAQARLQLSQARSEVVLAAHTPVHS